MDALIAALQAFLRRGVLFVPREQRAGAPRSPACDALAYAVETMDE
jgi:hypothetical protein